MEKSHVELQEAFGNFIIHFLICDRHNLPACVCLEEVQLQQNSLAIGEVMM